MANSGFLGGPGSFLGGEGTASPGRISELFEGMDPEQIKQFIAQLAQQSTMDDEAALLGRDATTGQQDWDSPSPQGMKVGEGYAAASPVEHASVVMKRILGRKQEEKAMSGLDKLIPRKQGFAALLIELLRRSGDRASQPQPPPIDPGAGVGPQPGQPPPNWTKYA